MPFIFFEIQNLLVIPKCMFKFQGRLESLSYRAQEKPVEVKKKKKERKSDHFEISGLKSHSSWKKSLHLTFFLWVVPWVI